MEGRVGVMTDAEKKHIPVQIMYAADRARRDVGRQRQWIRGDRACFGPNRGKRVEVIAAQHAGQSPERIRDHPEIRRRRTGDRLEGSVVVARPRRHDQGAAGADGVANRRDQAARSSLDRPDGPEGRVYEQDAAHPDAEVPQLIGNGAPAQFGGRSGMHPSRRSVRPDAQLLHQPGIFLRIRSRKRPDLLRAAADRLDRALGEGLAQLGIGERLRHLGVEPRHRSSAACRAERTRHTRLRARGPCSPPPPGSGFPAASARARPTIARAAEGCRPGNAGRARSARGRRSSRARRSGR